MLIMKSFFNLSSARVWFLIGSTLLVVLLLIHTRGLIPYDEGWFLQVGRRMYQGELIYKDFSFLYTPGGVYVNYLAYKLFGVSVLASRLMALFNSFVAISSLLVIARFLKLKLWLAVSLPLLYIFWGPAHINFIWPVMLCLTTAVVSGAIWLTQSRSKAIWWWVFLTGVLSAMTLIFKQNFGLAIGLTNTFFLFLPTPYRKFKYWLAHLFGYLSLLFLQLAYWVHTKTLSWFLDDMQDILVNKIVKRGIFSSPLPWQYPGPWFYQLAKFSFYLLPLIISLLTIGWLWKRKKFTWMFLPAVSFTYYLLSIRPTTDYVHLAPLLTLSSVSLILLIHILNKSIFRKIVVSLMVALLLLGGYSAIFLNYYRWETPLKLQSNWIAHPQVLISTDAKQEQIITDLTNYFKIEAKSENHLFIYNFSPIYYLILDKKNPTRYEYLHSGVVDDRMEQEVVMSLQKHRVKYIMSDVPVKERQNKIAQYILANYRPVYFTHKYTVWQLQEN